MKVYELKIWGRETAAKLEAFGRGEKGDIAP